jgi:nucleoside-diphosphate-sugar epimerase
MKRTFVTGGSGFVGANLVRRLLADGHEVHVLLRDKRGGWRLDEVQHDLRCHMADLRDAEKLRRIIGDVRPEWIFHLAAFGAYSWQTDLQTTIETNIVGTINLINATLTSKGSVFINAGSSSEYGFKNHAPSETEFLEPNSNYAVTKAAATLFCRATAQARDVRVHTLRLYSVFGPYEEPGRLIPALVMHGFRGELPKLVNATVARDYVYVDDVTEAFLLAASQQTSDNDAVYNVGTGRQTSLRDVVEIARRVLEIPVGPAWGSMSNRAWDTEVWVADNTKIRREFQWQPRFTFEEGFRKTAEWFRQHPRLLEFYNQQQR